MGLRFITVFCFLLMMGNSMLFSADPVVVIAHRGASGYLPEHTLAAKAMAYGMGADYLEQDVVLTKDLVPIVLHDIHLDTVTNVAEVFPDRARSDGRFFAADFTLKEIKKLRVGERVDLKTGKAAFAERFPVGKSSFSVPTLSEEIELVQGLNQSTGRSVGIYVEIKSPSWHRQQGLDISKVVLKLLDDYGYTSKSDLVFVQCFDEKELRRIRFELKSKLLLVQLLSEDSWDESDADFDALRREQGVKEIAQFADAIGPSLNQVVLGKDEAGQPIVSDLVRLAHENGLVVHPYTFRADRLPSYVETFEELLKLFVLAGVDGVFTDFPDRVVAQFRQDLK